MISCDKSAPDLAGVHGEETVEEDQQAHQGGGDQHAGVPAQPGKVETDLLPKVPPGEEGEEPQLTGVHSRGGGCTGGWGGGLGS